MNECSSLDFVVGVTDERDSIDLLVAYNIINYNLSYAEKSYKIY